jgi:large subunit ribosomal protein L5e
MAFVKVQKNNTYYKRFQVKFRRRREGKTDYYQRKRLTVQRKNKYNTPKWRFVVRRTNRRIICQVVWSTIAGDKVKASADSFELRKYGLTAGLTNFAASYATGLLTARRLLTVLDEENKKRNIQSDMAKMFNLVPEATGEYVDIAALAEKKGVEQRPFTCFLDIGLARATSGNRVFAAMKGAVDGGLHIPHSDKIFPKAGGKEKGGKGDKGKDKGKAADTKGDKKTTGGNPLRDRIFGLHVQGYMDKLKSNTTAYNAHFSEWDKNVKSANVKSLEDLYKKVHAAIRAKPQREVRKEKPKTKHNVDPKDSNVRVVGNKKYRRDIKITREERQKGVELRLAKIKEFIAKRNKK